jgi:two-component system, cell cycle sensor histidine kinase and response regulator CckA
LAPNGSGATRRSSQVGARNVATKCDDVLTGIVPTGMFRRMSDTLSPLGRDGHAEPAGSADDFSSRHVVVDSHRLLHALDVGVVVQDRQLRIVYANPKATALLGITTDEITTRTTLDERWDVITPEGTPVLDHAHPGPRALRTGEPVTGVVLGVRRSDDAERVWILVSAIPEFDAHHQVERVVISFSDVSMAQRSLRAHEAMYQSVFRSMSEGLVIHNMDGTIRAANAAAERVLGLTVEQMTGRSPMDPRWRLVRTDGTPVGSDFIPSEVTTRTGIASQAIVGVHRPSGELAWLDVHADPLREPGEAYMSGVLATFTDITAERLATLALESSRAQMQRVLDAVPGIVYTYLHRPNREGQITFAAGRITEITGLDQQKVRENPQLLFSIIDDAAAPKVWEKIEQAADARQPYEQVIQFCMADGEVRWAHTYGIPEDTADGLLYTGVILDVTREQRMADALRNSQRREAMGDMAGGIAHNFNNMLAVILPNVQLAREVATGTMAQHLADAERAAISASDLVKRMLGLGRAEMRDGEQVDLVPIVREALHICRQTFDRGITIADDLQVEAAHVRGSASSTQQVVLNLLLNARDAMQGGARSELTVRLSYGADQQVELSVTDTGAGMDAETIRRIGEPFFTTKPPGSGTGLGLASAFHSINEAGGSWRVASQVGQGTTFTVLLPMVDAAPAPVVAPPATRGVLEGTILIIDDEPMVRAVLVRQMTRAGMRAEQADGAAAALELLRAGAVSDLRAILLDLSMPGLSGEAALPLLGEAAPGVPIIALSGHVPDSMTLPGTVAVLQKPLGQRELVDAVVRAVAQGG